MAEDWLAPSPLGGDENDDTNSVPDGHEPEPAASPEQDKQPAAAPGPAPDDALSALFDGDAAAPDEPAPPAAEDAPKTRKVVQYNHHGRRFTSDEDLFHIVDQIQTAISTEQALSSALDRRGLIVTRDKQLDAEQRQFVEELVRPRLPDWRLNASPDEMKEALDRVYDELIGLGPLGPVWRDDDVTEILVDRWDYIYVERNGELVDTDLRFRSLDNAQQVAREMADKVSGRAVSRSNPIVTAQLPGARVQIVYGDGVVATGISISIRKFRDLLSMERLLTFGSMTEDMRDFLRDVVRARGTVLVSGGTGSGKTTVINALTEFVPKTERIVTIEDAFELQVSDFHPHIVALQTKERASADDAVRVSLADLLVSSLRMRPDRIIVGEIRERDGARQMLRAANTGHDGTMSTIHANSAKAAVNTRLSNLVTTPDTPAHVAKQEVVSAIDVVVQATRRLGQRFISEIAVLPDGALRDGVIVPDMVFAGSVDDGGNPAFTQPGRLDPKSQLALKMIDAGVDISRWTS